MKKIISVFLSLIILLLSVNTSSFVFATNENTNIDAVVEELQNIYEEENKIGNDTETITHSRILLKATHTPKIYKDGEIIALNDNYYAIQYNDIETSNEALEHYRNQAYIEWAEKDGILEEQAWSFGTDMLGTEEAEKYCTANNITLDNEVKVAVIDGAIRFGMNPFKKSGRVFDSGFNSSGEGKENTANWSGGTAHGSYVASIILDSTTENVKIYGYRVSGNLGGSSNLSVKLGIDKAVEDGMQVINLSLGGTERSELLEEAIKTAIEKGVVVVTAAGNYNDIVDDNFFPASYEGVITVSAVDYRGNKAFFSNYGKAVDFTALGYDVEVFGLQSTPGEIDSGTSFSAPYITACCAEVLSINPHLLPNEVKEELKETCLKPEEINYSSSYLTDIDIRANYLFAGVSNSDAEDESLYYGYGFPQMQKILGEEITCKSPSFSYKSGVYNDTISLTISSDEGDKIYYTTDGKYPTARKGILYTEPIEISQTTSIRAIAYSDNKAKSTPSSAEYKIEYPADESEFTVDERGYITSYTGTKREIVIPDMINGKVVKGVAKKGLYDDFDEQYYIESEEEYSLEGHLLGVHLPDTVTEIEESGLSNTTLHYLTGKGLTAIQDEGLSASPLIYLDAMNLEYIGDYGLLDANLAEIDLPKLTQAGMCAFSQNHYLKSVNLPMLTKISFALFWDCERLTSAKFDNAKSVDAEAFRQCIFLRDIDIPKVKEFNGEKIFDYCKSLQSIELPNLENSNSPYCFYNCNRLENFSAPKLTTIDDYYFLECRKLRRLYLYSVEIIGKHAFEDYEENGTYSLVAYIYAPKLQKADSFPIVNHAKIILSSLFTECAAETQGRDYSVAGITGSYAETWAKKNGHTFIGIPFIDTDLNTDYTGEAPLMVKSVGVDIQYEWYGCDDKYGSNPVLIRTDGVQEQDNTTPETTLNPQEYKYYPYYFCRCIMYDNGNPFSVDSKICKNADYGEADYTEYNKAVTKAYEILANKENYTDCSAIEALLKQDVSNLLKNEQSKVDDLTNQINEAIEKLIYKPADYTELDRLVSTIPSDLSVYTNESVEKLNDVINSINRGLPIIQQDEVNQYCTDLSSAINSLTFKTADYTGYNDAVEKANEILKNKDMYTDCSELEKLLSKDVSNLLITEQSQLDEMTNQINQAIRDLVYKSANYEELDRLLSTIPSDLSVYTDESVEKLNDVINSINRGLPIIQQDEVNQYCTDLASAINGLTYKAADYTKYNEAVKKANSLDRNEYVDFSAVDDALNKDVSGKNITEQAEVDTQTEAILKAIEALKKKDVKYEIIKGANSQFDISKDRELVISSNAEFEKFVAVLVDDVELDKSAYSAKAGSTIITMKADYLKSLPLTEHSIVIKSTDGEASTVFTVVRSDVEDSTTKPNETTSPSTTKPTETTIEANANEQKESATVKRDNSLTSPKTGNNFYGNTVYFVAFGSLTIGLILFASKKRKLHN